MCAYRVPDDVLRKLKSDQLTSQVSWLVNLLRDPLTYGGVSIQVKA